MNKVQYALMITIFASMGQGENYWTQTSIKSLLKNLLNYHEIDIKRRWIFECLADLKARGFINTRLRYRHDTIGRISQIPSVIVFKLKGIVWLIKMGYRQAQKSYKAMTSYWKKHDGRFPQKDDVHDETYLPDNEQDREAVKNLLAIVTKSVP